MRNQNLPTSSSDILLDSVWLPKHSSFLHGSTSMMDLSDNNVGEDAYYHQSIDREQEEENGYEDYDNNNQNQPPGKKRRLTTTQVQFLEKNFQVENKLEPDRKVQLANQLGLQPRQVAIWFQNRRARFKNQQLEKDFDALKGQYDTLKLDYDNLLKQKQALKAQIDSLKEKLQSEETEEVVKTVVTCTTATTPLVVCKQEDASSAKSDVFDADSPHYTDENYDDLPKEHKSKYNIKNNLPPPPCLLKIEEDCYYHHAPPPSSCNFEDHPFWSWSY